MRILLKSPYFNRSNVQLQPMFLINIAKCDRDDIIEER